MKKTFMLPTMNFMIRLLEKNRKQAFSILEVRGLLSVIILSLLLASCAKDPGQIGYIIQPEDSRLNVAFSDTTTIYAYSKLVDSIRSDKLSVTAFGSLRDPVFGGTTAGFYTQFILSAPGHEFPANRVLDSLVFQLSYEGYYGDTNNTLRAHTYEMLDSLEADQTYYSNKYVPVGTTDYSNYTFEPRPTDSILIYKDTINPPDTLPAALRLNLTNISTELGLKLLNASADVMEDSKSFQEYFHGLFVQSEPIYQDGVIAYFGLATGKSRLELYYREHPDSTTTIRYDYLITISTATVNKYEHNYNSASAEFKSQVINHDTTLGQQKFYAQGYGGVQSIVKFPHIQKWAREGNVAINEAKLILPGYDGDEFFDAPGQMSLLSIEEDGEGAILVDQAEGDSYFDGDYNDATNSYEFRITRYIQSLVSDTTKPNRGLYLFLYGGSVHPERFIFKGNNMGADSTGMKLEILFTDL